MTHPALLTNHDYMPLYLDILGLNTTKDDYSKKVRQGNTQQKVLLDLAWKLSDFSRLCEAGRPLLVDLTTTIELIQDDSTDPVAVNIPRSLCQLCDKLTTFVRGM